MQYSNSVTGTFFLYNSKQSGLSVSEECVISVERDNRLQGPSNPWTEMNRC